MDGLGWFFMVVAVLVTSAVSAGIQGTVDHSNQWNTLKTHLFEICDMAGGAMILASEKGDARFMQCQLIDKNGYITLDKTKGNYYIVEKK